MGLWLIISFLLIIVIVICLCHFFLKKELKRIILELRNMNENNSEKRLKVNASDRDIDELSAQINKRLELNAKEKRDARVLEKNLRDTLQSISHDLRTPLTSILGFLQLLKRGELSETEQKENIDIIERRAKSLHSLINNLFELSTISSTDYVITLKPLNLNNLLIEALTSYYDDFSKSNITLELNIMNENMTILGNVQAINRVIENLTSNCIKYSKGDISVTLEKQGNTAILIFSNLTNDISSNDIDHLFDRFFTADKTRTKGNTGLGLAITKELMNKMNGTIYAQMKGNIFSISCIWKLSIG